MPPKKNKDTKLPNFEDSLEELEDMVESMESGQLALEELIATYERGAKLINNCESLLDDARKRLELITLEPKTSEKKHHDSATADNDEAPSKQSDDDEIRLF